MHNLLSLAPVPSCMHDAVSHCFVAAWIAAITTASVGRHGRPHRPPPPPPPCRQQTHIAWPCPREPQPDCKCDSARWAPCHVAGGCACSCLPSSDGGRPARCPSSWCGHLCLNVKGSRLGPLWQSRAEATWQAPSSGQWSRGEQSCCGRARHNGSAPDSPGSGVDAPH